MVQLGRLSLPSVVAKRIPDPQPGESEVVIGVSRCGVCGTDLHATSGHGKSLARNSQLGHEYGGEVVGLGKHVERLNLGDRLAVLPLVGCGNCEACKTGIDVLCAARTGYGGGLSVETQQRMRDWATRNDYQGDGRPSYSGIGDERPIRQAFESYMHRYGF